MAALPYINIGVLIERELGTLFYAGLKLWVAKQLKREIKDIKELSFDLEVPARFYRKGNAYVNISKNTPIKVTITFSNLEYFIIYSYDLEQLISKAVKKLMREKCKQTITRA